MLDCTDVNKLIKDKAGERRYFVRLVLFTQWQLDCLKQIEDESRERFPREQEELLFNKIKTQVKTVKIHLIQLDMRDLKFIGVILRDYKVGENVNFNKFLIESLFSSYKSISKEMLDKVELERTKKPAKQNIPKEFIEFLKLDHKIELDQYLDSSNKAKIDSYLNIRRDADSLYTIYSTIRSLEQTFKENEISIEAKRLDLQRLFHITGEYLKDTQVSPNLSPDVKQSLEEKGVPTKALSKYRDTLAHYQVFPLIKGDDNQIKELFDESFLNIQNIVKSEIIETEHSFVQKIIEEKGKESKMDKSVVERLIESKHRKGVQGLEECIRTMQSEDKYSSMDNETKKFVDEVYQTVRRMKSVDFPVDPLKPSGGELIEKKPNLSDSIIEYINKSKLQAYDKLRDEVAPILGRHAGGLKNPHADVLKITQVIDRLSYKDTSSPSNSIFDNFLSLPILENIYVAVKKGTEYEKVIGSSLKKELERYFDSKSFKSNDAFSEFKDSKPENLIDLLNNKISGQNTNKEILIRFFKSIRKTQDTNIPCDEYEGLVEGLDIDDNSKEKLFSYSIRWRKEKCLDLLKKNLPALKTIYDSILEGKSISKSVCDKFAVECGVPEEPRNYEQGRVDLINQKIEELYTRRAKEEFALLTKINDPYAVESQMINVYSLSEIASDKRKENRKRKRVEEKKFEMKKLRNYLSHGDPLISIEDHKYIAHQLVEVKNEKNVIDMLNEPNITPEKIEATMDSMPSYVGLTKIRELLCPPGQSGRSTRSASESCLRWEEIDKFNEVEAENRDPDNIIIDSEKFISRISGELEANEEKFSNFIAIASESEVIGDHTSEVDILTDNHRDLGHLERVGEVSGMAMHGMMAKNLVGDILRGDYKDVAINLGFLAGSSVLGKVAETTSLQGAESILKGSELLGKSLRFASPFISRGVTGFIAWDLFTQVKAYRKGDKDALVPIIGDSVQIATDAIEIGVEVAEVFGVLEGVSAVTGPIGMAVAAIVFVGSDIYTAVRKVEKIEEHIHLTEWQKVTEGSRAFFGLQPSDDIDELIEGKDGNSQALKNAKYFLKDNPHIQRYVFPSIETYTNDTSRHLHEDMYFISSILFFPLPPPPKLTRTYTRKVLDNVVLLDEKKNDIKWSRIRPDNLEGIDLFCLPKGDWESVPEGGTYYCDGAIGVEYTNDRTGNDTWISLGDGQDEIKGFQGSSNIFVFGDGHKNIIGGNKDDSFIFGGKSVDAIEDSEIEGYINGRGGIDTIDVGELTPHYEESKGIGRYQVSADFRQGILKDTSKVALNMHNINEFLGRKGGVDLVVSACDTKYVDGRGGENNNYLDSIIIPKNDACSYDTKVTVNPYTKVTNNATSGNFLYFVKGEKGKEAYIELGPSSGIKNTFVFNYTLKDVAAIDKSKKNITFSFVEEFYKREKKIDVNSSFNLTVSGADKNITTYYLIDRTKIVIGQHNVYAMQNTEKPIDSLIKDYSSIADKLQIYVVVHSNDEVLTVGHSHEDVLMNDPNARASHLVGGGGENVFAITSGHEKLTLANLPISNVVIYDFDQENKIDTLDLRGIKEQLKKDIDREIHTEISKIGSDLLINLSVDDASKKEVVKIRLKGALENNWYKRVNIVIDSIFVIKEILDVFELTPQPLIFDDNSKTIYVINPTDVGKGGKIRVKKEIGDYIFARDYDALVITNSLSPSADKNNLFTIILNDFYHGNNQDKMQSLKIEFNDQKIFLRKEIERINSAGNFNELKRKVKIDSYKAAMYAIKKQKLFEAIEGHNIREVKKLIDHGVSIDARNNDGQTPLQSAAKSGDLRVVKYLIEKKHADVNVEDNFANKPLHYAACGGNVEVVKYLVEEIHADVNYGTKPLHYAAYCGNLEVVKYLIEEKHANININDDSGITPLHYAASGSNLNVVKYLIEKEGANVNVRFTVFQRTVLHYAAVGGNLELVKYLIEEKGADVNVQDFYEVTPLHLAVSCGDLKIAKYLIEKGADIEVKDILNKSVLHYAAIGYNQAESIDPMAKKGAYFNLRRLFDSTVNGQLEVVKYLIEEKGAYVDVSDVMQRVPLHYAASMGGRLEIFKYFKQNRVICNVKDFLKFTPLHFAADDGKLEVVKYLVGKQGNFNIKDGLQFTPLHFAAADGRLEVVKYLVGKGADFNVKNVIGSTPLHFAAKFNRLEVVKYLIEEKGADINVRDYYERVPLHFAAENSCLEVVKYLVEEKGANINVKDYYKKEPLHLAAENTCLEVIKYRVEEKDVYITGFTLLHNAADDGDLEMVKYLIQIGAKIDLKINDITPLNILELKGYKHVIDSIVKKLTERLFDAVKYDEFDEVLHLINQGVSVNVKDSGGQPLLHFAASNGNLKVVKYLVEKKQADVNAKDDSGMVPLHYAAKSGNLEVVKYLIEEKGANVNAKDNSGMVALQYAITTGNLEMIKYLTETKGIDLNTIEHNKWMPVKTASDRERSDIMEYLERKLNEKRERPRQHKRSHYQSMRRLLSTDSSNQPEITTSNASEKSSWINDIVGSIVKLQESSGPSEAASINHPIRHERREIHNDHSRNEDGMRTHCVRHRHRRVQKRNVKYQDSHYYIDQPEIATSSGTRPSSWINGLLDWIKEKGGELVSSVSYKFSAKESEDSQFKGIHACSVRLENMHGATIPNIPQSRKSQGVPKGNISNTSWSDWSSNREKVTSNVTDAPEMYTTVLNNALILGDLAVRLVNGTRHKQPIHENLLSLREKSMRFIDENMIMRTIQQGKEKFGGVDTNMDV